MKIEIGESLVRTWMRHCMGCQLAELNWKPSPEWPGEITPEQNKWYADGAEAFPREVLKKTSSISQFIGQAEIDVLGVSFVQGKVEKVIAADIAFHRDGMLYVSKSETAARVVKKLFRSALTLDIYFPGVPAEIVFLSPKVGPAVVPGVHEAGRMMQSFFENRRGHFLFRTIINGEFKESVMDKVAPLQKRVADTSELYLRAAQLIGLFDNCQPPSLKTPAPLRAPSPRTAKQTLPIELVPSDPNEFRRLLLKRGAVKYEHYRDGQIKKKDWPAKRMRESSDIIYNLRSSNGYRQGQWQAQGMTKLVVKIVGFDT